MKKLLSFALIAALLLSLAACGAPAPIPNPPLVLGEKYLSDLDYEQALLQFDKAIIIEPKNPRGYLGKADALLHLNRLEDAVATLGAGAKAVPRTQRMSLQEAQAEAEKSAVDGYIALSSSYEKLGWREIALALLRRVCEELPEESRLREALEVLLETHADNQQLFEPSQETTSYDYRFGSQVEVLERDAKGRPIKIKTYTGYTYEDGREGRTDVIMHVTWREDDTIEQIKHDNYNEEGAIWQYVISTYDAQGECMRADYYNYPEEKLAIYVIYEPYAEAGRSSEWYDANGNLTSYSVREGDVERGYNADGTSTG